MSIPFEDIYLIEVRENMGFMKIIDRQMIVGAVSREVFPHLQIPMRDRPHLLNQIIITFQSAQTAVVIMQLIQAQALSHLLLSARNFTILNRLNLIRATQSQPTEFEFFNDTITSDFMTVFCNRVKSVARRLKFNSSAGKVFASHYKSTEKRVSSLIK